MKNFELRAKTQLELQIIDGLSYEHAQRLRKEIHDLPGVITLTVLEYCEEEFTTGKMPPPLIGQVQLSYTRLLRVWKNYGACTLKRVPKEQTVFYTTEPSYEGLGVTEAILEYLYKNPSKYHVLFLPHPYALSAKDITKATFVPKLWRLKTFEEFGKLSNAVQNKVIFALNFIERYRVEEESGLNQSMISSFMKRQAYESVDYSFIPVIEIAENLKLETGLDLFTIDHETTVCVNGKRIGAATSSDFPSLLGNSVAKAINDLGKAGLRTAETLKDISANISGVGIKTEPLTAQKLRETRNRLSEMGVLPAQDAFKAGPIKQGQLVHMVTSKGARIVRYTGNDGDYYYGVYNRDIIKDGTFQDGEKLVVVVGTSVAGINVLDFNQEVVYYTMPGNSNLWCFDLVLNKSTTIKPGDIIEIFDGQLWQLCRFRSILKDGKIEGVQYDKFQEIQVAENVEYPEGYKQIIGEKAGGIVVSNYGDKIFFTSDVCRARVYTYEPEKFVVGELVEIGRVGRKYRLCRFATTHGVTGEEVFLGLQYSEFETNAEAPRNPEHYETVTGNLIRKPVKFIVSLENAKQLCAETYGSYPSLIEFK